MHKIAIIGHFGFNGEYLDGQTIKTKIVARELQNIYGQEDVSCHDTHGGIRFLVKMPFVILTMMLSSQNVIMMPARKGLRMISPVITILNTILRRKIYYVVIGGWLPEILSKNGFLLHILKHFNGIFVETASMQTQMRNLGFDNVIIMPNCKPLDIIKPSEIRVFSHSPYPLCTFSRVVKEKGIEDAIKAVKICNEKIGHIAYTLDIYGQIGKGQQAWFNELMTKQPEYIRYRGCVNYSKSVEVLRDYFMLLFPTFYSGECFAGTIIDAFAAGLPVIASDWHDNANIIKENITGHIFPAHSTEALSKILYESLQNTTHINNMKSQCIREAAKYQPNTVIKTLTSRIN